MATGNVTVDWHSWRKAALFFWASLVLNPLPNGMPAWLLLACRHHHGQKYWFFLLNKWQICILWWRDCNLFEDLLELYGIDVFRFPQTLWGGCYFKCGNYRAKTLSNLYKAKQPFKVTELVFELSLVPAFVTQDTRKDIKNQLNPHEWPLVKSIYIFSGDFSTLLKNVFIFYIYSSIPFNTNLTCIFIKWNGIFGQVFVEDSPK